MPSPETPVQVQTYPCLWRSAVNRPWGYCGCPGVSTLFSAQRRKKHISPFWVKQTEIVNVFKEHEPICTLHASPSSTATKRASVGLSIILLFSPEKSIATREFSDILLWKRKHFFLTRKMYLKSSYSALLAIGFHSRTWFQRWLARNENVKNTYSR